MMPAKQATGREKHLVRTTILNLLNSQKGQTFEIDRQTYASQPCKHQPNAQGCPAEDLSNNKRHLNEPCPDAKSLSGGRSRLRIYC